MNLRTPVARFDAPHAAVKYATPQAKFGVRLAEISALRPDGSIVNGQRKIPTLPEFDQAVSGFAQGTVFKTDSGYCAVEDLQPGDWLMTVSGSCEQLIWIGSTVCVPGATGGRMPLIRITADSFGLSRPESFISLGPAARILQTPPDLRNSTVASRMMTPANRFLDGVNVIETVPPSPLRLFHLGLKKHSAIIANGLGVESYHPGTNAVSHMSQPLRDAFHSLFPHVEELADFGPMQFARAPETRDHN